MEGAAIPAWGAVSPWTVVAFVLYLGAMVAIGIRASRFSSAGLGEFFLAGRGLSRVVVALSAVSSGRSGWLLLGFSGLAFARGASALWAAVGYTAVEFVLCRSFGRRLRRLSGARDCLTLPDALAARLGEGRGWLRLCVVAVLLLFTTPYLGAQFVAGGKTFHSVFGLPEGAGIALTATIVLAYTVLGGFLAVSLTDVVQSLFMLFALIALPLLAVADLGGWSVVWARLSELDPTLVDPLAIGAGVAIGLVGIGLGSPGSPHILVRYMSIRDPEQLRGAAWISLFWNVAMALGAAAIGLAARAQFGEAAGLPAGDRENAYPALATAHPNPFLLGIVIASIFAAIMSTADSQLLVAASAVVRDVYEKLILRRRGERRADGALPPDPRRMVLVSRLVIVALVAVALVVAWLGGGVVFWLVLFAWAGMGAAFGPVLLLSLYWRGTTRAGALAGMAAGVGVLVLWVNQPALKAQLYELVPAFAAAAVVTVLVSLVTRAPGDTDEVFALMEGRRPREG